MSKRKYIVKIDADTFSVSFFQFFIGQIYRKIRGWSPARIIGSFTDV